MNIKDLKTSKYLRKEDVGKGVIVTIKEVKKVNVASDGEPVQIKFAMFFNETAKPLILNATIGAQIATLTGSEESDDWVGKKIVLYNDATVMFKGKVTGGIRARAMRQAVVESPVAPVKQEVTGADMFDPNDIIP